MRFCRSTSADSRTKSSRPARASAAMNRSARVLLGVSRSMANDDFVSFW